MPKRSVRWSNNSLLDIIEIMDYYNHRNKSKTYSLKLYRDIKSKLKKIDFSIALPQKTNDEKLFYFSFNHISVFFEIQSNEITVHFLIDERRNPESINRLIISLA